jgi:hypothetical protein
MKEVIGHWVTTHGLTDAEAEVWIAAADKWRMPYWDWARQQSYTEDFAYPRILVQGPVRIYPPAQVKQFYPPSGLYANPFWGFENPEKDENGDPRAFGDMPGKMSKYNIKDDPPKHGDLPPQNKDDKNQWFPVSAYRK